MKVMNLDVEASDDSFKMRYDGFNEGVYGPVREKMMVSMKALYLGWPQVKKSDPYLVSMLVLMKEEYLRLRKVEKKALHLVQMWEKV